MVSCVYVYNILCVCWFEVYGFFDERVGYVRLCLGLLCPGLCMWIVGVAPVNYVIGAYCVTWVWVGDWPKGDSPCIGCLKILVFVLFVHMIHLWLSNNGLMDCVEFVH